VRLRLRRPASERGSSSLELALLAPGLLLLTLLIVQTAFWFHARQVAQAAVEQGARATRAYQGTEDRGRRVTTDYFGRLGGPKVTEAPPNVNASRGATNVTVTLTTTSVKVIPFWSWPVVVRAGGPIEQFQPPAGP